MKDDLYIRVGKIRETSKDVLAISNHDYTINVNILITEFQKDTLIKLGIPIEQSNGNGHIKKDE